MTLSRDRSLSHMTVDILHSQSITRNPDLLLVERHVSHDMTRRLMVTPLPRSRLSAGRLGRIIVKRDVCLPDYHLMALLTSANVCAHLITV